MADGFGSCLQEGCFSSCFAEVAAAEVTGKIRITAEITIDPLMDITDYGITTTGGVLIHFLRCSDR